MPITDSIGFRLAASLAIGLLIGAERERRKSESAVKSSAGIRTFAVASLLGGVSLILGGERLLAVATLAIAALAVASYLRTSDSDPGLTTEAALVLTVLLGGLAQQQVVLASGVAVVVTILLAARTRIHAFVRSVLSEEELTDAIVFAAAVLVVLPLTPDRYLGPYGAINPRIIWKIVILIMAISAAGHIAVRLLGVRFGLPIAGLASGFVSSTATIAAMGQRAAEDGNIAGPAVAGAVLSTVATVAQLAAVLAATSEATLHLLRTPLLAAGIMALVYGGALTLLSIRQPVAEVRRPGRAFSLRASLLLAAIIALVLFGSGVLNARFGEKGLLAAVAIAGFADTHSAAVSAASLVAAGKLPLHASAVPILVALSTNTISKIVVAVSSGGWRFARSVVPGLVLVIASAWGAFALM
ncbi:MAG TPA: DUF4010 domain-containing protein [Terriglobales bacterium]|jgi:uncharacterized membrane protein (DUF4010 family)|nr:DUF4010 domain-containing protein [Terriglobales bacterium]